MGCAHVLLGSSHTFLWLQIEWWCINHTAKNTEQVQRWENTTSYWCRVQNHERLSCKWVNVIICVHAYVYTELFRPNSGKSPRVPAHYIHYMTNYKHVWRNHNLPLLKVVQTCLFSECVCVCLGGRGSILQWKWQGGKCLSVSNVGSSFNQSHASSRKGNEKGNKTVYILQEKQLWVQLYNMTELFFKHDALIQDWLQADWSSVASKSRN